MVCSGLQDRVDSLGLELEQRRKEFQEKEAELNWVYQQRLEQAAGETKEKEKILEQQQTRLTDLQRELVVAIRGGEEKDMEIYRRENDIR